MVPGLKWFFGTTNAASRSFQFSMATGTPVRPSGDDDVPGFG